MLGRRKSDYRVDGKVTCRIRVGVLDGNDHGAQQRVERNGRWIVKQPGQEWGGV